MRRCHSRSARMIFVGSLLDCNYASSDSVIASNSRRLVPT
jgi:hypothetical protein